MNQTNIVFFGAPGAGKGTQAKKISESLSLPHIDTGSLIREAIANKTILGMKAKEFVEAGKLVPDDLVIALIKEKLANLKSNNFKGFVLDGYPRTIPQAEALDEMLLQLKLELKSVLNIKVQEELLIKRLSSRRLCSNKSCGAIYNLITKKPKIENKCDLCGDDLYQRKDDSEDASKERLREYKSKTAPIEDYYKKRNKLFDINGEGEPNKVYNEILKVLNLSPKC